MLIRIGVRLPTHSKMPKDCLGADVKILVAHNSYASASPSGENLIVELLSHAMRQEGIEVEELIPSSDKIISAGSVAKFHAASRLLRGSTALLERRVVEERPHVVMIHNPVPTVSGQELRRISTKIPVVHVVHNFRHSCVAATNFRDRKVCNDCELSAVGRLRAVQHRCYRSSSAQTAILAGSEWLAHDAWRTLDRYVAISRFMKSRLIEQGFPADRIDVIYNAVPQPTRPSPLRRESHVLYAGRLTTEKGIELLVDTWTNYVARYFPEPVLHIAGAGPSEALVEAASRNSEGRIRFHGLLSPEALAEVGQLCRLSVIPSIWPEPFGLVAAEALAAGRGIIVTDVGALPEIALDQRCSWLSMPDAASLGGAIRSALMARSELVESAAFDVWEKNFAPRAAARKYIELATDLVDAQTRRGTS